MINRLIEGYRDDSRVVALALGGSYARNTATEQSDFDLFILISSSHFDFFREHFSNELEDKFDFLIAEEFFYIESWGYIFKALDKDGKQYDISILPENRIDEMGIKSSNIVLIDKTGAYTSEVANANDDISEQLGLMISDKRIYAKRFIIDTFQFLTAWKAADYWVIVKFLEKLRKYLMVLLRIKSGSVGKHSFAPEKKFSQDVGTELEENYSVGSLPHVAETFNYMVTTYLMLVEDSEKRNLGAVIELAGFCDSEKGILL